MLVKVKKEKILKNKKISKENKNKIMLSILLFLVILLGILVGMSFAKYQTKTAFKGFANIAKPILEVRREQSMLLTALAPKASYVFEVSNYKENELNEVEMEYYIEIVSHTDESIYFNLYQGNKEIPLVKNKTEKIKLAKDEKQTHLYRLEVTYDKTKEKAKGDINENVEIKIHSIQKA